MLSNLENVVTIPEDHWRLSIDQGIFSSKYSRTLNWKCGGASSCWNYKFLHESRALTEGMTPSCNRARYRSPVRFSRMKKGPIIWWSQIPAQTLTFCGNCVWFPIIQWGLSVEQNRQLCLLTPSFKLNVSLSEKIILLAKFRFWIMRYITSSQNVARLSKSSSDNSWGNGGLEG